MYLVDDMYREHGDRLGLELVAGEGGVKRPISVPEAQRPGLSLCGYLKSHATKRILVFGKVEIEYLRDLKPITRRRRLRALLTASTPAVIIARGYRPPEELVTLCEEQELPLLRATMTTMSLLSKLTILLAEQFAPQVSCHGTLVEVHRLVSDDIVRVRKVEGNYLEGVGAELTRHHMEVRGIGIINVAHLYGAVCVRDSKSIDLVVKLEVWDDNTFYDRVGLDEKHCDILSVKVPHHVLPVKPGRDVVLLLETIALNHRLKEMGYNSAKEFNTKLLEMISLKQKVGRSAV